MKLYLPHGLLKRATVDLSDLTSSQRCGEPYWAPDEVDVLVVPFDVEPTEVDAVRRRLVTADADDEARLYRLLDLASTTTDLFQQEWVAAELIKYGEV